MVTKKKPLGIPKEEPPCFQKYQFEKPVPYDPPQQPHTYDDLEDRYDEESAP